VYMSIYGLGLAQEGHLYTDYDGRRWLFINNGATGWFMIHGSSDYSQPGRCINRLSRDEVVCIHNTNIHCYLI